MSGDLSRRFDDQQFGRMFDLGGPLRDGAEPRREIVENETPEIPAVCLRRTFLHGNTDTYDGLRSVLDQAGFSVSLIEKRNEDTYRKTIEGTVYPETEIYGKSAWM